MDWTNFAILTVTLEDLLQDEDLPIRTLVLQAPNWSIKIGRGSQTDVDLRPKYDNAWFGSRVMSRDHAILRVDPITRRITVKDVGSMHGTFVDGTRLEQMEEHPLSNHIDVTFGADIVRGELTYQALTLKMSYKWSDEYARPVVEEWMDGLKSSSMVAPQSSPRRLVDGVSQNCFAVQYSDEDEAISDDDIEVVFESYPRLISHTKNTSKDSKPLSENSEHSSMMSTESEQSPPSSPAEDIRVNKVMVNSSEIDIDQKKDDRERTSGIQAQTTPDVVFVREQPASSLSYKEALLSEASNGSYSESDADEDVEEEEAEFQEEQEEEDSDDDEEEAGQDKDQVGHEEKEPDDLTGQQHKQTVISSTHSANQTSEVVSPVSAIPQAVVNAVVQDSIHIEADQSPVSAVPWYQTTQIPSLRNHLYTAQWGDQYQYNDIGIASNPYATEFRGSTGYEWASCAPGQYQDIPSNPGHQVMSTSNHNHSEVNIPQTTNRPVSAKISINDILDENTSQTNSELKRKRKADEISSSNIECSKEMTQLSLPEIKKPMKSQAITSYSAEDITHDSGSGQGVGELLAPSSIDLNPIILPSLVDSDTKELPPLPRRGEVGARRDGNSIGVIDIQPPRKKAKLAKPTSSNRRTFVKYTATALAGAAVGAISTVIGLAALPADYFL